MKRNTIIYILALSILMISCKGIYEDTSEMAADMRNEISSISVNELKQKVENTEDFLLIDIRQPSDFYTSNIPGSVMIQRGLLEFKIADTDFWMDQYMYPPEKNTEIVLYCNTGDYSTLAAMALKSLGYANVKSLDGGYKAFNPNQDPNAKPIKPSGGCGG
jgi:rhodanese-related sulfurtransferase